MRKPAILIAALFAATTLVAQDTPPAGAAPAMPNPKQKEHEAFKSLAGTWETLCKMEAMPGVPGMDKPTETKGSEHAELICNGLWLKSVLNGTWMGEPWQGVWIAGYDPYQKKYVSIWISSDDQECGVSVGDGSYDPKTKSWTWTASTKMGDMRSTLAWKSADESIETCYMKGPDGAEKQCMQIVRTRAKGPIAAESSAKAAKPPAKEQLALHRAIGNWEASSKMVMTPGMEPNVEKATENVTPICNGRWLWTDYKSSFMGMPFEGHAIVGYDPNEKKYVSFWFDSMSPSYMRLAGECDKSGNLSTLEGTCIGETGEQVAVKETFTWKDDDNRVMVLDFQGGAQLEITYRRKK
jgi:hypothetical protein